MWQFPGHQKFKNGFHALQLSGGNLDQHDSIFEEGVLLADEIEKVLGRLHSSSIPSVALQVFMGDSSNKALVARHLQCITYNWAPLAAECLDVLYQAAQCLIQPPLDDFTLQGRLVLLVLNAWIYASDHCLHIQGKNLHFIEVCWKSLSSHTTWTSDWDRPFVQGLQWRWDYGKGITSCVCNNCGQWQIVPWIDPAAMFSCTFLELQCEDCTSLQL